MFLPLARESKPQPSLNLLPTLLVLWKLVKELFFMQGVNLMTPTMSRRSVTDLDLGLKNNAVKTKNNEEVGSLLFE